MEGGNTFTGSYKDSCKAIRIFGELWVLLVTRRPGKLFLESYKGTWEAMGIIGNLEAGGTVGIPGEPWRYLGRYEDYW